ncbi:unnamed protein product [Closterium sp. NIES-53]
MVQQVLQRFDFTYSSPQSTPLPTGHSLSAPPSDESVEPNGPYPELVGFLITLGMGLVLGGRARVVLTCHAYASWADDLTTQQSSQGYTFSLGSGSVSWRSTRSSSVLSSSCEAEIYAGAMAALELCWLTYLLTDLGEPPCSPPVLYVDNKSMIALCQEHRLERRTKHIALHYFLARELRKRGQLRLVYMATRANTVDVFTKALQPCDHLRCCTVLGLVSSSPAALACPALSLLRRGVAARRSSLLLVSPDDCSPTDSPHGRVGPSPRQWTEPGGAESEGVETGGGEPGGVASRGGEPGFREPEGVELEGAASEGAESGGAEPQGAASSGASGAGGAGSAGSGGRGVAAGAGVIGGTATTGPGGTRIRGTGAAGTGGVEGAGAGDLTESGTTGAGGAGGAGAEGAGFGGPGAGGARVGGPGVGGAGAGGAGAVDPGGAVQPRPYFVPLLQQSGGLTERREPASRPVLPVRTARRVPVPGTHAMTLRPSSVPLRVPLPTPLESSLPEVPDPESDHARAVSPTVSRLLATAVSDPSFESAHVAELLDFAAACRLDYATALVAESASACPPSVGGECALGTDVLEDRQEDFQSLAGAAPMDAEMASWKSTGTYVDEVPPPGANIVDGMWIFRVKRPPGSPPAFNARYVARGFSQRQEVDYFQTFSPTPKMTTLWVLLHVAAQCDYELHSLDFSTAFLQGSLHEEICLRQVPREWHDTLRTTLAALGFAPSTADPSLFLRTDTSLPAFYVLAYVLQRFGFQFSSPQPTPLSTSHSLSAPPSNESVEPSGPYPELVGCLISSCEAEIYAGAMAAQELR